MVLRVTPLRFEFEAVDAVWFPAGKAANIFRGGLGLAMRSVSEAAYARLFAPEAGGTGPSGFENQPRPFVMRAAVLDGCRFAPGQRFVLEMNTFDPGYPVFEAVGAALGELAGQGLGLGRPRARLVRAEEMPEMRMDLQAKADAVRRLGIRFLTPTELKTNGAVLREPRFDVLLARARDRVSSLCAFYQEPLPDLDYAGLGERARSVVMTAQQIRQVEVERRSTRTGQTHGLGGFIGKAVYEGELAEFMPWLQAACLTGVGRMTVWGNGVIALTIH